MKYTAFLLAALWLVVSPVKADRLGAQLDSLMSDPLLETSQLGLMVWDVTADSLVFAHGERQLLRPASTMKVLTAVTALDCLGGETLLRTRLWRTGHVEGNTLFGDLVIEGGIDPLFSRWDMEAFARRVKELGIDTLCGRIVVDASVKDTVKWGPGWCWDDDNPTIEAFDNICSFDNLTISQFDNLSDTAHLSNCEIVKLSNERVFMAERTHPLDALLRRMMKASDNLYAECLYYLMADSLPRTARGAQRRERELIARMGLNADDYRLADGSGLSLYNYVSAELLVACLRYAWAKPDIIRHLWPSLPIAADDGTLRHRLVGTPAAGNIHAKTGTVTGIASLAGYATTSNNHVLAFAIINQGVLRAAAARKFQDKLCLLLCQ